MKLMLFIPMYNCAPQIPRVLGQLTPALQQRFGEVFVVDNGSRDGGTDAAIAAARAITGTRVVVARNDGNYNLGGSHKVAMQRCLEQGWDGLVVFHGDDQGTLADLLDAPDFDPAVDCVLGARFMRGSRLQGYAPFRIVVNVAFNGIFSALTLTPLWDLGSGLNYYSRAFLERRLWEKTGNDLTFNYFLILRTAASDATIRFVPISWREDDQISNAKLWPHGVKMLRIVRDFALRRRWFLDQRHDDFEGTRSYTVLAVHDPTLPDATGTSPAQGA